MPSYFSSGSLEAEPRGGILCKWFVEGELSGTACKDKIRGQQRGRFSRSPAQSAWPQGELWRMSAVAWIHKSLATTFTPHHWHFCLKAALQSKVTLVKGPEWGTAVSIVTPSHLLF